MKVRYGKTSKPELITTVDADLLERARNTARERGISVSAIVERALDRFFLTVDEETRTMKDQRRAS